MSEASFYVLEFCVGAPNDALSEHHVVATETELKAIVEGAEPELLQCDLVLWVVQRGRVTELVDLKRFVRVSSGSRELRWDDEDAFVEAVETARDRGEVLVPECVWDELGAVLPKLEAPVLTEGQVGVVNNPKVLSRFARERGLESEAATRSSFTYGRHGAVP